MNFRKVDRPLDSWSARRPSMAPRNDGPVGDLRVRAGRHQGLQAPTPAAVLSTNDKNTADDYSVGLPALSQFPEPRMNDLKSGLQYVGVDSRQLMTIIGPARVFSLSPESCCKEIQMKISVACPRIGVTVTRGVVLHCCQIACFRSRSLKPDRGFG